MAPVWAPPRCAGRAHPRVLAGTRRAGTMMGVLSSPDPSVEAIFRAGGLAGPTNAPGARGTARSRRRKRDAKLRDGLASARGWDDPGRRPRAVARRGVPAFEPSRRLAPAVKNSNLVKNKSV